MRSVVRPLFDDAVDVEPRAGPRLVTLAPPTGSIPRETWLLARWRARHAAAANPHIPLEAPLLPNGAPRNEERKPEEAQGAYQHQLFLVLCEYLAISTVVREDKQHQGADCQNRDRCLCQCEHSHIRRKGPHEERSCENGRSSSSS